MKIRNMYVLILLVVTFINATPTLYAQGGDQILDGIGETGMVARYIFDGDVKDWSRNGLHGKLQGTKASFVEDPQFGKVLSLSGGKEDYVLLPAQTLTDLESLSMTGWIYLRAEQQDQCFFDFGERRTGHFFVAPVGTGTRKGYQAVISTQDGTEYAATSSMIPKGRWVHMAVVIDIPAKSMRTYLDGKSARQVQNIPQELAHIIGQQGAKRTLRIGRSLLPGTPGLDALLHDFRIYRIPLSQKQVDNIYTNALKGENEESSATAAAEDDLPKFPISKAQLYNAYLIGVSDVTVETEVGELPRLPSYVEGTYRDGMAGPKVRVLWPAPSDNNAVLQETAYTIFGHVPGTDLQPKATITVKGKGKAVTPGMKLEPFRLDQVVLTTDGQQHDTKFMENRNKFLDTLAKTDPNSFLYMFRHAFGQRQPDGAEPLGVWDSQDTKLRGHATGHYMTAIAQAYASTGYDRALQAVFLRKMDTMVNVLYTLSQLAGKPQKKDANTYVADPKAVPFGAGKSNYDSDLSDKGIRTDYWNWGKGYISAYPPDQFIMLEKGAKYGGQKNQVWAPYYTLHKILAGLMDIYEVSGNQKALDIACGMGDWVYARLREIPDTTRIKMWNTYIAGEFGGMNEVMARMYRVTQEKRYLSAARLFDNIDMFYGNAAHVHGLAKNVDTFRGLHANQHIPQIVGSMEMYRVSHEPDYYKVADNFWYKVVNDYMYSIGGVAGARNPANAECFISQPATLYENGFSSGGQNETCATYNMLKLTSDLFLFDQRAELMDYYECGLYNHILASVAKDSPANTYHVPLRPGAVKQFGNPDMKGFTCCNGTAIESSTKLQNTIYFKSQDNQALYVNLYIPSTLSWKERGMTIEQTTSFPKEDQTSLKIKGHGRLAIYVRVPGWATKGFFVTINGEPQHSKAEPGTYVKLDRSWKDGDLITLKMPFQFHLDPVMDQQNIASLFYGPILLAAQEPVARKDWRKITLDAHDIGKSIKGNPATLEFTVGDVRFKPFYDTYGRHSVYLDVTLE
ncbi:glycoside hydrolase family 127 protein [Sphingobacterium sp. N143]|uniref:beta-L-arabinofuranosidase domain-containing protein n=1 Tax=Sphingobacterium sp. N143 TaxID=2746727 RepID=UPI0025774753|nr:beta-L-arabinofuranosidase domain-containing protein [Sphingobacterium sp. N143]MDM1296850.1 glycoside hydrolase family 127 protein [Sphingobacterium sp. N143]